MNFNEQDLLRALKADVISVETCDKLLEYLKSTSEKKNDEANSDSTVINNSSAEKENAENNLNTVEIPNNDSRFNIENFLYYFGGFIVITTATFYLGSIASLFGVAGMLAFTILYFVLFVEIGNFLWNKDKKTPGGLLYVCAVSIVPLIVWEFENLIGIMPKDLNRYEDFHVLIRSGYIFMELATIFVGFAFFKFRKFPLLTLPICFAMWYLSMDIVPFLLGHGLTAPTWGMKNTASCIFSLIMLWYAVKLDKNNKSSEDCSHWLYNFGATMLWGSIISIISHYRYYNNPDKWIIELTYFLAGFFSFVYMCISIIIKRRVFMVWGAIGFWSYLGYLSFNVFEDTPLFPIVLIIFGLSLIFSGVYYSKNCKKMEEKLRKFLGLSNIQDVE